MKKFIIGIALLVHSIAHSCGMVGYIGSNLCKSFILQGLSRLQYRGHDSAGFACLDQYLNTLVCIKTAGSVDVLKEISKGDVHDGYVGIGHTRWATHGKANTINAHPQLSNDESIAVVHNGIIQNTWELRRSLIKKGYQFLSETDTEIIVHLFADRYATAKSLYRATVYVVNTLRGTYDCILMFKDHPDTLVVIRKGLPVYIGIGQNEMYVVSDVFAFQGYTDNVICLPNESFALIKKDAVQLYNFSGRLLNAKPWTIEVKRSHYNSFEYKHSMLKELFEEKYNGTMSSLLIVN